MGNTAQTIECHFCHKSSTERKGTYRTCKICNENFCNYCNDNPILIKSDSDKYVKENG